MTPRQNCSNPDEQLRNIRSVFRDHLSLFVGAGKRFEVEAVAGACCKSPDTIHSYLRGVTAPDWATGVILLRVLPTEFGAAVLRPAGLTGFRRVGGLCSPAETLRDVAVAASTLATALADGRIDHTEAPAIRRELNAALVAIAQFLAKEGA